MKMAFDNFGGVNAEFMVVCVEAEPSASNDVVRCAKLVWILSPVYEKYLGADSIRQKP